MKKVGHLGPDRSTFGSEAAEKFFGLNDIEFVPFRSHTEIIEAVADDKVEFGVVAVENVIDGPVSESVYAINEACQNNSLSIFGEVTIPINQYLLRKVNDGTIPSQVLSHSSAIAQCRQFIMNNLRDVEIVIRSSTGVAAKEASENPDLAVFASERAQKMYGLKKVVAEPVQDFKNNCTRFWILSKKETRSTGNDKTCLLVNLEQSKHGTLNRTIGHFAQAGINLLIIYPIPIPGKTWEYTFMLEFKGHEHDQAMMQALNNLRLSGETVNFRVLGSYPVRQ